MEHYADGDVFDAEAPTRYHDGGVAGLYAWGPDLPKHIFDTGMSPRRWQKWCADCARAKSSPSLPQARAGLMRPVRRKT